MENYIQEIDFSTNDTFQSGQTDDVWREASISCWQGDRNGLTQRGNETSEVSLSARISDAPDLAKILRQAVKDYIAEAVGDSKTNPKDLVDLARQFNLLSDDSVKRTIFPPLINNAMSSRNRVGEMANLFKESFAKDPVFRDELYSALAFQIKNAKSETRAADEPNDIDNLLTATQINSMIGWNPGFNLSEKAELKLDDKTTKHLTDLRTALSGTKFEGQLEYTLNTADLSSNRLLNELYESLKSSGDPKIDRFLAKPASKQVLIDAWKEQIKSREFNDSLKDARLNQALSKRPLDLDVPEAGLKRMKELLAEKGFPTDEKGSIVGLSDDTIKEQLRRRARTTELHKAVSEKIDSALTSNQRIADLDPWRTLSFNVFDPRGVNAIDYKLLNEEVYKGEFEEGVQLDLPRLRLLWLENNFEDRKPQRANPQA